MILPHMGIYNRTPYTFNLRERDFYEAFVPSGLDQSIPMWQGAATVLESMNRVKSMVAIFLSPVNVAEMHLGTGQCKAYNFSTHSPW